jgi:hypothetical protein
MPPRGGHSCVAVAAYVKPLGSFRFRAAKPTPPPRVFIRRHPSSLCRVDFCSMTIAGHATEVPDSEDELFSSSPEALPDGRAIDQLDGTVEECSRDASSQAGDFSDPFEDTAAEHTANPRVDERRIALADVRSLDSVARADHGSDVLRQYANELRVSHQHASSLTDTCDPSNQLSSVPTNPASLHVFNRQEHAAEAETASCGGEKEPVIPGEESVFNPAVGTANTASFPSCVNDHSPTTDSKLLTHNQHPVLPSVEDVNDSAYSEIAPPRNNSPKPTVTKDRGCSCPLSVSPTDPTSSSNEHILRRYSVKYGRTPDHRNCPVQYLKIAFNQRYQLSRIQPYRLAGSSWSILVGNCPWLLLNRPHHVSNSSSGSML